tara:strand:- start:48 stop:161 length:114 start_codon:yes stop_codon:yes gene_type:complete
MYDVYWICKNKIERGLHISLLEAVEVKEHKHEASETD